ncbi:hypothetical protein R1sor_023008 [Riccia sorocarpa]|uniref:DUF4283 domain-containing protein n=1 Tax=Riccia sorocarpa TaxID=122646 RepID=A0ABD3GNI9_9MARC
MQGVGPAQIAQLRPIGVPLTQQYAITSPTKNQMDYRAAVSPAKGGNYSNQLDIPGNQYRGLMIPYNLQMDSIPYTDDGEHLLTDTGANSDAVQPGGEDGDDHMNIGDQKESEEPEQYAATNQQRLNHSLQDIPESDEEDLEADPADDTKRDSTFIDRHSVWVDMLDENLQKTRKNPASKQASVEFEIEMSDLLSAVEDIIETTDHDGKVVTDILQLDSKLFAEGIKQLQQNSLVIMSHNRPKRKANAHIFANSLLKMGNKIVFPLSWDTRFTTRDLKSRAVPVWLELYNVHPGLMKFGLNMLGKVGPIIYAAKNTETQRINIMRGCILMDLSKPLPNFIPIMVPEAPVMPLNTGKDDPPRDNQSADPPRTNPNTRREDTNCDRDKRLKLEQRAAPTGPHQQANPPCSAKEFRVVKRRTKPKFHSPEIRKRMRVDNRYGILEEPMEQQEAAVDPIVTAKGKEIHGHPSSTRTSVLFRREERSFIIVDTT